MDGALIIDKPAGLTSHDVVSQVRRIIGERRVGHTGTLDPFATGVLVILIGRATRLAQYLSGAEKEYDAVIRLGQATDTGDVTGAPLSTQLTTKAHSITALHREKIEAAIASLRGEIEQTPPMYSAKKIKGRKLYELARVGEQVARKPIQVNVRKFELAISDDQFLQENENGTSDLGVRVVCSAGTYIRALAEELGRILGVGAHLAELRRTRAGHFKIEDAITLQRLSELEKSDSMASAMISPDAAISFLASINLSDDDVVGTLNGIDMEIGNLDRSIFRDGERVRMRDCQGKLIAIGAFDAKRKIIHPATVIANS